MIGWFIGSDIGPITQEVAVGMVAVPKLRGTAPVLYQTRTADPVLRKERTVEPALDD